MPKRSIYLQPSDYLYRRTRPDLEFLCNYWDRLLNPNQSDIRLPELLRANHLMRQLSSLSLPSNRGLQVNVSFTILDDGNRLVPEETYQLGNALPNQTESRNGFHRSPCNSNAARYNNLLRNYIRQINENYAAIERELMRARILAPLVERDVSVGCQNAFYNQRAATCDWNKFPAGNRACSARVSPRLHERHVNPRERSNCQACASIGHTCFIADRKNKDSCSINQESSRQTENLPEEFNNSPRTAKRHSLQTSAFCNPIKKLQSNNNTLQNCTGIAPARNDNGTIKQQSSKELMETCQDVSKIISGAAKISQPAKSMPIMPDDDGVALINNSDKRSIDPVSCQGNIPLHTARSNVMIDQNRYVEHERGGKCKLDNLEDQATAAELDLETDSQQDRSRMIERIKPRVNDVPTIFTADEQTTRSRIRNGKIPMGGKQCWKKYVSTPKYASFLRMLRKEETDDQLCNKPSSRRNEGEKSQYRKGISAESSSTEHDNTIRNPRFKTRTAIPKSTVHTTYNPIMHSSGTNPILDSSGLTIQLLRLAVLLYAPTLMPALNSLIAQQNQQTPASTSSALEGSNDLLMQIFRLLNEQQSIPNLPFVSIGSERVSSALIAETNGESSQSLSKGKEDSTSTVLEKSDPVSEQGSISTGKSWKSSNHVQRQNGRNKKWRLTSMLADSDVRLDENIFTTKDIRKFEEFLKVKKKRPEDVRSLSTKSKNEIVMKEYFRNWLHRLLQQLNSANNNHLSVNVEDRGYPEGSSRTVGESSLEGAEEQHKRDRSDESPDSSRDDDDTFSEREEEDSDDQKSFTSVTSANPSRSQFKQNDAENEEKLPRNENLQD